MADPKLVGYLRKYVPEYGADAVRVKLLEEGVDENELDEAFAIALKPPAKKPPLAIFVIFGVVAVGAAVAFLAMDKPAPSAPPRPPAPGGELPADGKGPHMGHYGYMIKVPDGHDKQTTFKDMDTTEILYIYKTGTDPQNFLHEGLYGQLGIIRLEVRPRRIPEGLMGMEAVKAGITTTLNARGDNYTMRDVQVAGLPGFVVNISQPFPLVQSFLIGSKVLYVMTGGVEDQAYSDTLQSLSEVSPHDRPHEAGK